MKPYGGELQKVVKEELGDESRIRGNGQSRSWTLCQELEEKIQTSRKSDMKSVKISQ